MALDSLETPFGVREDVLGGSATYFSTAASFFAPVRVVAVVGEDFPEDHVDFLRGRGVDLAGLERRPGRTFRWSGRYEFDLNQAHTLDTQLNVFADFRPELPRGLPGLEPRLPRQHRPGAAAVGARPGARAALRGRRHHELLDHLQAAGPARGRCGGSTCSS